MKSWKSPRNILVLMFILLYLTFSFTGCAESKILTLSGTIESTQLDVNSEVMGKVIKIYKDEGNSIKTGDVLADIDSSTQQFAVKQQDAAVKLKQAKLDELKAGSRDEQIDQAEAAAKAAKAKLDELKAGTRPEQLEQAQAAVNNAKTGVDTAQTSLNYWTDKYEKAKALRESNAASENDLTDARYKMDTASEQLKSAESQYQSAAAQLELLKNGATSQSIQGAQANYEQALSQVELLKKGSTNQAIRAAEADLEQTQAALDQAKLNLSKYNIRANSDGVYLYKNVNIGDIVNPGSSIGTISDTKDSWVKVYIPQRNLQAVSLNQEVTLNSIALPGKTIKGQIIFISSEAEYTPKNTETNESKENTVFKLKIKILDNVDALKPGMTVDANIPLGGK